MTEKPTLVEPGSATPPEGAGYLPQIKVNDRQLRDYSDEALEALQAGNNPPLLFARSGRMVSVIRDEKQRQIIREVNEHCLRGRMSRSANYVKVSAKGHVVDVPPPLNAVQDILAMEPSRWEFNSLDGVVEAPILRADGSILDIAGYDPATALYYAPDPDLVVPTIAERPTTKQRDAALKLINMAIGGFPFVKVDKEKDSCASKANLIATMLTPIVKPAINAPTPLALFDAPQAGTGKSLLAEVVSIVATGRPGEMFSAPRDEDEWRKQLTMALKSGTSVVVIDNVNRKLDNPDLCKVLTETTHADREFKTHNKMLLPVKATFIATGNNIQIGGDMPRRCYWIRLDAEVSQPFLRTDFAIENLKAWTAEHRGELLAALLTLARAWYAAGKPKPQISPLGSFEAWSTTVGGILEHAGIKDFLGNAPELYAEADSESIQWENFFRELHNAFNGEPFTAAEIAEKLQEKTWDGEKSQPTVKATILRGALPEFLVEGLTRDGFFQRRAGRCFAERVGRRFGTSTKSQVYLKRAEVSHGAQRWKVIVVCQPAGTRELGELEGSYENE